MITYIRHAEYLGTQLGSSTGSIYQELTSTGRDLCVQYRTLLCSQGHFSVYSSTAGRALETSVLLFPRYQINLAPSLLETDGGSLSLIPESYVLNKFGIPNTIHRQYPGGESNVDMHNRVMHFHNHLLSSCAVDSLIFVVCHSGPISCIANSYGLSLTSIPFLAGVSINHNGGEYACRSYDSLTDILV